VLALPITDAMSIEDVDRICNSFRPDLRNDHPSGRSQDAPAAVAARCLVTPVQTLIVGAGPAGIAVAFGGPTRMAACPIWCAAVW